MHARTASQRLSPAEQCGWNVVWVWAWACDGYISSIDPSQRSVLHIAHPCTGTEYLTYPSVLLDFLVLVDDLRKIRSR